VLYALIYLRNDALTQHPWCLNPWEHLMIQEDIGEGSRVPRFYRMLEQALADEHKDAYATILMIMQPHLTPGSYMAAEHDVFEQAMRRRCTWALESARRIVGLHCYDDGLDGNALVHRKELLRLAMVFSSHECLWYIHRKWNDIPYNRDASLQLFPRWTETANEMIKACLLTGDHTLPTARVVFHYQLQKWEKAYYGDEVVPRPAGSIPWL